MEVIEYGQTFGAKIDRATNREDRLAKTWASASKHYDAYVKADVQWGDLMDMNFRMVIKITTDIKLNLINDKDQSMIQLDDHIEKMTREIHYMQIEGTHASYPLSFGILKEIWRQRMKPAFVIKDWTITDFDNCLNGNPLLPPGQDHNEM